MMIKKRTTPLDPSDQWNSFVPDIETSFFDKDGKEIAPEAGLIWCRTVPWGFGKLLDYLWKRCVLSLSWFWPASRNSSLKEVSSERCVRFTSTVGRGSHLLTPPFSPHSSDFDLYRYQLPIYISENGITCPNENDIPMEEALHDDFRINYFTTYCDQMALKVSFLFFSLVSAD